MFKKSAPSPSAKPGRHVKSLPVKVGNPTKQNLKKPEKIAAKPVMVSKPVVKEKAPEKLAVKSASPSRPSRWVSPVQLKSEPFRPAPAVATNLKPRKSQIGIGVRELEHYADLLLAKRRELVGDMSSMEREALRSGSSSNLSTLPVHMADMGTDNYEQEFTLGLVEKDRNLLREINHALAKIQNGTYGICEGTGRPIGKPRLEAQPWARFSIEYARQVEKNGMGVRTL